MPKILDSLLKQLKARGAKNPYTLAIGILQKEGILNKKGGLTKKGKIRNSMTHAERVKDRAYKPKKHS